MSSNERSVGEASNRRLDKRLKLRRKVSADDVKLSILQTISGDVDLNETAEFEESSVPFSKPRCLRGKKVDRGRNKNDAVEFVNLSRERSSISDSGVENNSPDNGVMRCKSEVKDNEGEQCLHVNDNPQCSTLMVGDCVSSSNQINGSDGVFDGEGNLKVCHMCLQQVTSGQLRSHVSVCIKRFKRHTSNTEEEIQQRDDVKCGVCEKTLSHMNTSGRLQHVNRCIDQVEKEKADKIEDERELEVMKTAVLDCPVCGKHLNTENSRRAHMNRCAKENGVSRPQLLEVVKRQREERDVLLAAGEAGQNRRTAGVKGNKLKHKPSKRKRIATDMELAVALSTSMMEEQQRRERGVDEGNMAFPPSDDRARKSRKCLRNEAVPGLLLSTPRSLKNEICERVSRVVTLQDPSDGVRSTPDIGDSKLSCCPNQSPDHKAHRQLWSLCAQCPGDLDLDTKRHLYYVSQLMPPIEVTGGFTGRYRRLSLIPGRRKSTEALEDEAQLTSASCFPHPPPTTPVSPHNDARDPAASQTGEILAQLAAESDPHTTALTSAPQFGAPQSGASFHSAPLEMPSSVRLDSLSRDLSQLCDNPAFSDITVITSDIHKVIHAHKVILAARSPRLMQLLSSGCDTGDVFSNFSHSCVMSVVQYMYTGVKGVSREDRAPVHQLAHTLGLPALCEHCELVPENGMRESQEERRHETRAVDDDCEREELIGEVEMDELYEYMVTQRSLTKQSQSSSKDNVGIEEGGDERMDNVIEEIVEAGSSPGGEVIDVRSRSIAGGIESDVNVGMDVEDGSLSGGVQSDEETGTHKSECHDGVKKLMRENSFCDLFVDVSDEDLDENRKRNVELSGCDRIENLDVNRDQDTVELLDCDEITNLDVNSHKRSAKLLDFDEISKNSRKISAKFTEVCVNNGKTFPACFDIREKQVTNEKELNTDVDTSISDISWVIPATPRKDNSAVIEGFSYLSNLTLKHSQGRNKSDDKDENDSLKFVEKVSGNRSSGYCHSVVNCTREIGISQIESDSRYTVIQESENVRDLNVLSSNIKDVFNIEKNEDNLHSMCCSDSSRNPNDVIIKQFVSTPRQVCTNKRQSLFLSPVVANMSMFVDSLLEVSGCRGVDVVVIDDSLPLTHIAPTDAGSGDARSCARKDAEGVFSDEACRREHFMSDNCETDHATCRDLSLKRKREQLVSDQESPESHSTGKHTKFDEERLLDKSRDGPLYESRDGPLHESRDGPGCVSDLVADSSNCGAELNSSEAEIETVDKTGRGANQSDLESRLRATCVGVTNNSICAMRGELSGAAVISSLDVTVDYEMDCSQQSVADVWEGFEDCEYAAHGYNNSSIKPGDHPRSVSVSSPPHIVSGDTTQITAPQSRSPDTLNGESAKKIVNSSGVVNLCESVSNHGDIESTREIVTAPLIDNHCDSRTNENESPQLTCSRAISLDGGVDTHDRSIDSSYSNDYNDSVFDDDGVLNMIDGVSLVRSIDGDVSLVSHKQKGDKERKLWVPPSPFSPMVQYNGLTTPQLKTELHKYGVKAQGKKRMVNILENIYRETHQYETDSEFEASFTVIRDNPQDNCMQPPSLRDAQCAVTKATARTQPQLSNIGQIITAKNHELDKRVKECNKGHIGSGSSSDSNCDVLEESFMPALDDTPLSTQDSIDVNGRLLAFFKTNVSVRDRVLMYDAIELDWIRDEVKKAGIKCSMQKLMAFMDDKCITFTMKSAKTGNKPRQKRNKWALNVPETVTL